MGDTKKVEVTIGSTISVDKPTIEVKKDKDNVKWINDAGIQFGIKIPGYADPSCKAEGGKYICVSGTLPSTGTIKYDVTSPGKPTLDPDLQVIP